MAVDAPLLLPKQLSALALGHGINILGIAIQKGI